MKPSSFESVGCLRKPNSSQVHGRNLQGETRSGQDDAGRVQAALNDAMFGRTTRSDKYKSTTERVVDWALQSRPLSE